jgi:hypothetical protein
MRLGIVLAACVVATAAAAPVPEQPKVVVTQEDEDAIRKALREFREHTENPRVAVRSDTAAYLNCPGHATLLKYGWKAVPYLIEQSARQQGVEAVLGAAAIGDKKVKTPEEVAAWNAARREKVAGETLPPFVLATVLRELPPAKDDPDVGKPEVVGGFAGIRPSDSFAWVTWWAANGKRFEIKTKNRPQSPPPRRASSTSAGSPPRRRTASSTFTRSTPPTATSSPAARPNSASR